jgi:hypothetical protein
MYGGGELLSPAANGATFELQRWPMSAANVRRLENSSSWNTGNAFLKSSNGDHEASAAVWPSHCTNSSQIPRYSRARTTCHGPKEAAKPVLQQEVSPQMASREQHEKHRECEPEAVSEDDKPPTQSWPTPDKDQNTKAPAW